MEKNNKTHILVYGRTEKKLTEVESPRNSFLVVALRPIKMNADLGEFPTTFSMSGKVTIGN